MFVIYIFEKPQAIALETQWSWLREVCVTKYHTWAPLIIKEYGATSWAKFLQDALQFNHAKSPDDDTES